MFVDGVAFRLVKARIRAGEVPAPALLRSYVAARAFGVGAAARTDFDGNPFGPPPLSYGLVDDLLLGGCLTAAEVPLCTPAWTASGGIQFVDLWSVRRRIVAPPADTRWPLLTGDRTVAEADAMLLQFQAQAGALADASATTVKLAAADRFAYLPPVGMIPIPGGGGNRGFDPEPFFGAQGSSSAEMTDAATLRVLVAEGARHATSRWTAASASSSTCCGRTSRRCAPGARATSRSSSPSRRSVPRHPRYGAASWNLSRFAPTVT